MWTRNRRRITAILSESIQRRSASIQWRMCVCAPITLLRPSKTFLFVFASWDRNIYLIHFLFSRESGDLQLFSPAVHNMTMGRARVPGTGSGRGNDIRGQEIPSHNFRPRKCMYVLKLIAYGVSSMYRFVFSFSLTVVSLVLVITLCLMWL